MQQTLKIADQYVISRLKQKALVSSPRMARDLIIGYMTAAKTHALIQKAECIRIPPSAQRMVCRPDSSTEIFMLLQMAHSLYHYFGDSLGISLTAGKNGGRQLVSSVVAKIKTAGSGSSMF